MNEKNLLSTARLQFESDDYTGFAYILGGPIRVSIYIDVKSVG